MKYEEPDFKIILFNKEDVIRTSLIIDEGEFDGGQYKPMAEVGDDV